MGSLRKEEKKAIILETEIKVMEIQAKETLQSPGVLLKLTDTRENEAVLRY
jgi:hypothetical protein